jgi:acyl-CoA dehydrogenase
MDETGALLAATSDRLFTAHCTSAQLLAAERGIWPAELWNELEASGLTRALLPEPAGGAGLDPKDALALIRAAGRHAAPAPLAETFLAGWLLAGAGIAVPDGPLTILQNPTLDPTGRLTGTARRVPWGRHAAAAAALIEQDGKCLVALLPASGWCATEGTNLAVEPRDDLALDGAPDQIAPTDTNAAMLHRFGAALRTLAIAGALQTVLEMTVAYAQERVQFGRPIGKFQAIQQNLAILAGQTVAAGAAADIAVDAFAAGLPLAPIAAAKARAGEAAGIAASIAHQVHGAIGFTQEHRLHFFTKRLWSWRDEFGNEAEWQLALGRRAAQAGERLWSDIIAA